MNDSVKNIKDFVDKHLPNLSALGEKAANVVRDKEDDFLSLGQAMQDVKQKCTSCQDTVVKLTDVLSGERMGECSSRMSREMEQMREIFSQRKFSRLMEQIEKQGERVSSLVASEQEFKRIVKRLGMLGISTRIESARLGEEGRNFGSLAVDVEGLAEKIIADAKQIKSTGLHLRGQIDHVLEEVREIDSTRSRLLEELFSGIRQNLDEMENMRLESLRMAENMQETARRITEDVSAIVSSMQFHDITRQQLEHVQHVLEESREEAQSALGDKDGEEESFLKDLATYIGDVCQLQAGQMRNSHKELDKAFNVLQDKFTSIEDMVREIVKEIGKEDKGKDDSASRTVVGNIVHGLNRVRDNVEQTGRQNERITSFMDDMRRNMSEIEGFVDEIEEVGSEVELLALNASVKAARTGENGQALGVIAVAIQHLSYEARDQSGNIVGILQESLQASDRMAREAQESFDLQEVNKVNETLESLISDMQSLDEQASGLQSDVHSYADQVLGYVHTVFNVLEENRSILSELEDLYLQLEDIAAESADIAPNGSAEHSPRLQKLLSRYTMESERMVHDMISGLERIGEQDSGEEQDSASESEDWDNVELF